MNGLPISLYRSYLFPFLSAGTGLLRKFESERKEDKRTNKGREEN